MKTVFIEATNRGENGNWGKFMVGRFEPIEWYRGSVVTERSLLHDVGWGPYHILVYDLQTGEGGIFKPGGDAHYDLEKHKIWVCPLFEPFLGWLYKQDLDDLNSLPRSIELPEAPFSFSGYRRKGPE
jgi:hypothetical protein